MQVGFIHHIKICDPDPSDSSRSQILQGRTTQSAGAYYQYTGPSEQLLPLLAQFFQEYLLLVAWCFTVRMHEFS